MIGVAAGDAISAWQPLWTTLGNASVSCVIGRTRLPCLEEQAEDHKTKKKMYLVYKLRGQEHDHILTLEIDLLFDEKHVLPHCHLSAIHLLLRLRWKRKKHSVGSILANRVKRINTPINLLHCSFFKEQM